MELHQWISDLGLPVGLIALGVYFVWRAARFFAPLISHLTEKHCELIETLKEQSSRQTDLMESQNEVLAQHGQLLRQIHLAVQNERKK